MTVRPDQDTGVPIEPRQLPGEVERERTDISVVSILSVLALMVAAGLWFFTKDKEMVASDGTTVKQTSGSGSQEPPASNTRRQPTPQQ